MQTVKKTVSPVSTSKDAESTSKKEETMSKEVVTPISRLQKEIKANKRGGKLIKFDQQAIKEIHQRAKDVKVTATFYDRQMRGDGVSAAKVVFKTGQTMQTMMDSEALSNYDVGTEQDDTEDEPRARKDHKKKKGPTARAPPGYGVILGEPRPAQIGPLRIEKEYTGDNSSAFKSQSRNQLMAILEEKQRSLPGLEKYRPNNKFVWPKDFPNGIKIQSQQRNTLGAMLKISPCLSSLSPEYIRSDYKRKPEFVHMLNNLDKIERNLNLDEYDPKSRSKVHKILRKNFSKQEIRMARLNQQPHELSPLRNKSMLRQKNFNTLVDLKQHQRGKSSQDGISEASSLLKNRSALGEIISKSRNQAAAKIFSTIQSGKLNSMKTDKRQIRQLNEYTNQ